MLQEGFTVSSTKKFLKRDKEDYVNDYFSLSPFYCLVLETFPHKIEKIDYQEINILKKLDFDKLYLYSYTVNNIYSSTISLKLVCSDFSNLKEKYIVGRFIFSNMLKVKQNNE